MNSLIRAARDAAWFHQDHKRRNGEPYIRHPGRLVARAMCLPGASEQALITLWLHDVPEDTAKTEEEQKKLIADFAEKYGTIVGQMLQQLTNPTKFTKADRATRKAIDRRHLSFARPEVKGMKLLDRIDNLQELMSDIERGLERDLEFAGIYVVESRQLLEEVLTGVDEALEQELDSTIKALGALIVQKVRPQAPKNGAKP